MSDWFKENIKCTKKENIFVDSFVRYIKEPKEMIVFRELDKEEKETVSSLKSIVKRGNFNEFKVDLDNYFYVDLGNHLFKSVLSTLNGRNTNKRLFSYSKSILIPLLKYVDKEDDNPMIVIRKLYLNTFGIRYTADYFNYIKDYEEDSYYSYSEVESLIPANKLLSYEIVKNVSSFLYEKSYNPSIWREFYDKFTSHLIKSKEAEKELADMDGVRDIIIDYFTLDMTTFCRWLLNYGLEYGSEEKTKVRRHAGYEKDREIISTIPGTFNRNNILIIGGKKTISLLQVIVVSFLYLKMVDMHEDNKIIEEIIVELKGRIPIIDLEKVNEVLKHIEKYYLEEAEILRESFIGGIMKYSKSIGYKFYEEVLNACCFDKELINEVISNFGEIKQHQYRYDYTVYKPTGKKRKELKY